MRRKRGRETKMLATSASERRKGKVHGLELRPSYSGGLAMRSIRAPAQVLSSVCSHDYILTCDNQPFNSGFALHIHS